jgi:rhodanese-related sulfurtransferase
MDINQIIEFSGNHSMLVMALAAILVMLAGDALRRNLSGISNVEPRQATRLLNTENAIMVDIRSTKDFREGHIANSIHLETTQDASSVLDKYRSKPLIVYCNSGNRSIGICGKLHRQGFANVYNLKGGLLAWRKAELPISRN